MAVKKRGEFRQLRVWQMSMDMLVDIYKLTKTFPKEETYGLVSQMRRAVFSVSNNIAEGNVRVSNKDFSHFLTMSLSSCTELENQIEGALRLEYISQKTRDTFIKQIQEVAKMLRGLRNTLI